MRQGNGFSETAWLIWLSGAGCDGCTQALIGAAEPSLEDLLLGNIPDAPRLALIHPQFGPHFFSQLKNPSRSTGSLRPDYESYWKPGERYETLLWRAANGELHPFILVLDGALYNEPAAANGSFAQLGLDRNGQPMTTANWLKLLAPRAEAVLAVGSCASFGGMLAAQSGAEIATNGSVNGIAAVLGQGFRSHGGLPVVHLPGCAPAGEWMIETLLYVFLHLAHLVPLDLDEAGRPRWLFNKETYPLPARADYLPAVEFEAARQLKVACPVPAQGWVRGLGGCTRAGGGCIACTEPNFADQHLPFARPDMAVI
jgi:hydrogenase small subunit